MNHGRTPTEAGAPYSASWPPCAITASAGSAASTVANHPGLKDTGPRPQQQPTSSSIPTLLAATDAASHPNGSNYAVRPRKRTRHNPYTEKNSANTAAARSGLLDIAAAR
ncbi:hypothetical protein THAOC_10626, partial [Thalassiosira oceanica]